MNKKLTIISAILTVVAIASILWYRLFPSEPVSEPHYQDYRALDQPRLIPKKKHINE